MKLVSIKRSVGKIFRIALCLSLTGTSYCFSQTNSVTLPQIIPPSPQSQAFQRYGEYPVNYNIGVPDISIPIYTVKSGGLEVPIILRYYASGIKPNDPDLSNIGAGWTLDIGGLVTRTVEGKADELFAKPYPMKTPGQINQENLADIYYLDNILEKTQGNDSRYDRFSYSLGDRHGSFAIEDDQTGNFTAYSYPYVPYKINVHTGAPADPKYYRSISGIDITDDKGTNYQFGYNNTESASDTYNYNVTGWYLEKVSDPGNAHQISFTYESIPEFGSGVSQGSVQVYESNQPGDNGVPFSYRCSNLPGDPQGHNVQNYTGISYKTKNIRAITFSNGSIQFNLDASKLHIESMVVYNNDNQIIKTIIFNRDNFPGSTKQFRLNSLQISGNSSAIEKYVFSYDETYPVADNRCLVDQWGYCRGEGDNTTVTMRRNIQANRSISTTSQDASTINITVGDQDFTPNEYYMQRYILKKIQYPTGGTSEFVYEGNKYFDVNNQTGGGLRIKQIISKDGQGNVLSKNYEYDPGFLEYPLSNILYSTQCGFRISNPCFLVTAGGASLNLYYSFRTRTLVNGWNSDLGSNNVFYKRVTEYIGDATTNTGKTVYNYTYQNPNSASITTISDGVKGIFMPNYYMQTYKNWGNGLLKTKEVFKNSGNGIFSKVEDITNNYEFVNQKTLSGLYVYIVATYDGYGNDIVSINSARNNLATTPFAKSQLLQGASVNTQSIVTGAYYLTSTVENKYDGGTTLSVNTSYEHNNPSHYYPTKIIKDLSTGEKNVTSMAYVDEFSSDPTYSAMKSLNILSPVIEQKQYIRNSSNTDRLVSGLKTNYIQWNNNPGFYPQTVQTSKAGSNYENRIVYNGYDNLGNVQEVNKAGAPPTSYLWGYSKEYPIAQVTGASHDQVAYSSCEEPQLDGDNDDNGTNIVFNDNSPGMFSSDAKTGQKSYNLINDKYFETANPLPVGTYNVSYWSKGNGKMQFDDYYSLYNVIDQPADGRGWQYHQVTVNVTSPDYFEMYSDAGGNPILVDDIRIHPIGAQMITYTFSPLVGMTSMTDAKGMTVYYEYDNLQRLINIKDQDGNIKTHYCYNYAGQQTDCAIVLPVVN